MFVFFTLRSYITRRRAGNRIDSPGQLIHVSNWAEALPTLTALTLLAAVDFRVLLLQLTKIDYQVTRNCCCVTNIAESTSQIQITIYYNDHFYGLIPHNTIELLLPFPFRQKACYSATKPTKQRRACPCLGPGSPCVFFTHGFGADHHYRALMIFTPCSIFSE